MQRLLQHEDEGHIFYSILTGFLPDVLKSILVERHERQRNATGTNHLLLLPLSRALPSDLGRRDFRNRDGLRSTAGFNSTKNVSVRIPRWSN